MFTLKVKELNIRIDKSIGLIGKAHPEAVFFKTRFGIHTFGLKFPIDVMILDKNNHVKIIREKLLPNRVFLWNPFYEKVVELPLGSITKNKIKINDQIKLI